MGCRGGRREGVDFQKSTWQKLIGNTHRYRKEQIPDSSCSLIDLPLTAKRENAGALGHWPKKKIAYLFPYKFANFENQNLLASFYLTIVDYFINIYMLSTFRFEIRLMFCGFQQMLSILKLSYFGRRTIVWRHICS